VLASFSRAIRLALHYSSQCTLEYCRASSALLSRKICLLMRKSIVL